MLLWKHAGRYTGIGRRVPESDYEPDCDYVDGVLEERNLGEYSRALQDQLICISYSRGVPPAYSGSAYWSRRTVASGWIWMRSSKISAPNYQACLARLPNFLATPRSTEVLVVSATTEAAAELVRLGCEGALIGAHAISLRNLARVLAESRLCASGFSESRRSPSSANRPHCVRKQARLSCPGLTYAWISEGSLANHP